MSATRGVALGRAGVVLALVLVADRITKHAVKAEIVPGHVVHVVAGVLELVHDENDGVAFGFFGGGGAPVIVVTGLALCALLAFFLRRPERPWLWLPTGLVVGGAIGNLLDRVLDGSVTDFIKLPHWPPFNVSDIAITIGVLSLIWVIERTSVRDGG